MNIRSKPSKRHLVLTAVFITGLLLGTRIGYYQGPGVYFAYSRTDQGACNVVGLDLTAGQRGFFIGEC